LLSVKRKETDAGTWRREELASWNLEDSRLKGNLRLLKGKRKLRLERWKSALGRVDSRAGEGGACRRQEELGRARAVRSRGSLHVKDKRISFELSSGQKEIQPGGHVLRLKKERRKFT